MRLGQNWWLHGRTRDELRQAIASLPCYIATVETANHRIFQFLETSILPDNKLINFALDDAFFLEVMSSRTHTVWALATGSRLGVGNDPVYVKTRCFDPFPFPAATEAQQARIRELGEALDAHRKRQQAQHPALTLTDLYNVVEKLRANQPLTPKEHNTKEHSLAAVVLSLHQQLDAAVAAAYGWPADLPEAELLARLVHLYHQRQREEATGQVRYLHPAYQAPGSEPTQSSLMLPATTPAAAAATPASRQLWPADVAPQMQAVRAVVQGASQPLTATQVAAHFRGTKPTLVQPLLDTLAALALIRHLEFETTYAA